ncbi:MAG: type II toxin-antitoxin system RelE/ParE family toxin [Chitinivibrionales bacterium]|nr:type II toxin-antitoxin system RelE/ParE family toxin [Chitinivibrionales bacterium]
MSSDKPKWKIIYYRDKKGRSEVFDFFAKRKAGEKAKVAAFMRCLENEGPQLPRPYADLLEDGIHELRVKLKGNQTRVLYFFCYRSFIVLTNVFIKKSDKVPPKEIRKAKKLRADFLERNDEQSLRRKTNVDI